MLSPLPDIVPFGERLRASAALQRLARPALRVRRNENVYMYGDRDDSVYLIQSGQIKLSTCNAEAKSCTLGIFGAGDVFGELSLVTQSRAETATAMKDSFLRQIKSYDLLSWLTSNDLIESFVNHLLVRIAVHQQTISNLVTCDSERRLASVLLQLGKQLRTLDDRRSYVECAISQQELAQMVGTTRTRVGQFLKKFRALGLIEKLPRAFPIINEERLTAYLETTGGERTPTPSKKMSRSAHY
ncbi:MAG TPA: Crp/Fnr family transcriptional regulator [Bryobacteraceae bacterium]|nr:Crp/Fnr family transcriptional regulator [Bryobacteraceae bacterium]